MICGKWKGILGVGLRCTVENVESNRGNRRRSREGNRTADARPDETQRTCEPATVVQKQTRNPQRFRFGRVKSRLKNETARVGGHHRWPTLCMKLEPGIVPSQLKVYIISELDVTERAFSTYNDKARMWTQMDTEMVLALPVEEHHRLDTFTYKDHRFLVHTNIIRRRYSPLRQLGPSRDKVGTCEARRRNEIPLKGLHADQRT
jgi:hypothetical protein